MLNCAVWRWYTSKARVILIDGSGVSSRARGNKLTSDVFEKREKSAKSHVIQGRPTSTVKNPWSTNDANTEVHHVCRYLPALPSIFFRRIPFPPLLLLFFVFQSGVRGGEREGGVVARVGEGASGKNSTVFWETTNLFSYDCWAGS